MSLFSLNIDDQQRGIHRYSLFAKKLPGDARKFFSFLHGFVHFADDHDHFALDFESLVFVDVNRLHGGVGGL